MTSEVSQLPNGLNSSGSPIEHRRVLAVLLSYLGRYKSRFVFTLALALIGVGFELAKPWPVQIVVDYGVGDGAPPAWVQSTREVLPGAETDNGLIAWSVVFGIFFVIGSAFLSFATLNASVSLGQMMVYNFSIDVYAKLQRLSLRFHGRQSTGDLIQRMSQDVFSVYFLVANVAIPAIVSIVTLCGIFYILTRLDFWLAMLSAAVVPMIALGLAFFAKPMDRTTNAQYAAQGAVMALVEQSLSAIKVIQGFAREDYVQRKVEQRSLQMSETSGLAVRVSGAYNLLITAVTGIAAALILGIGAMRVADNKLTIGELLVFLGYLSALYGPVTQLTMAAGYAVQVSARGRRVVEVLDAQDEVPQDEHPLNPRVVRGEVEFCDVSFSYASPQSPILGNISFVARPGELCAIVGPTGAGKTTLVSLLSRFFDPSSGSILIDGIDIRRLSLRALRENVALVLQEPFLFPMSVSENIAFGHPDATTDDIVAAAKAARAHEFILGLPGGYATVLDERAGNLSGGERQRISIARAVLKNAPIVVFDEPTSALDAHTEWEVFSALEELMKTSTSFVIAHRLSTIRNADQIIVIDEGRIVEQGNHDSLIREGKLYQRLYRHQQLITA